MSVHYQFNWHGNPVLFVAPYVCDQIKTEERSIHVVVCSNHRGHENPGLTKFFFLIPMAVP